MNGKSYSVDNCMDTVFKFEELSAEGAREKMTEAVKISLGEEFLVDTKVEKMSIPNFKVLMIAIMAAMQDMEYEEAESRFHKIKS